MERIFVTSCPYLTVLFDSKLDAKIKIFSIILRAVKETCRIWHFFVGKPFVEDSLFLDQMPHGRDELAENWMNDEETIRALMSNRGMILAFLGSIVGCPETAEDIFQEVAVVALKRKDELSSPELLGPWFRQVARFQALNHLKKKKLTTFDAAVLDAIDAAWDGDKIDIRVDALRNCIDRLPKKAGQNDFRLRRW